MSGSNRIKAGAITAVAQVLTMAGSSLLGLLIARRLGSSEATDGFFAANTVYGIALFAAGSLRTSAPASLVRGGDHSLRFHGRAVALIGVLAVALFGVVAAGANVLLPGEAATTLRLSLAILTPAALAQLLSGLLAARCGVLGEFTLPAAAYGLGALSSAILFLILQTPLGVDAISVSVAGGALITGATMLFAWRRAEARRPPLASPEMRDLSDAPPERLSGLTASLLRGALPTLAGQLVVSGSTFAAGHTGAGNGTLFSYGQLAIAVLTAIIASPVSIVLAADVAQTWDRRAESLVARTLGTFRLAALLLTPMTILLLTVGPGPARYLMTALSGRDIDEVFLVAALITPAVLTSTLSMVPMIASVANGTVGRVGGVGLVLAAVHTGIAMSLAGIGSLTVLAVENLIATVVVGLVPIVMVLGPYASSTLRRAGTIAVKLSAPGAVAALAAWFLLGADTAFFTGMVVAAVGLAVHAVVAYSQARHDVAMLVGGLRRGG